ncbi:MAG: tRNA 2-selenouridine(34) synthase MnmH [Gammaproteobacteria bacterium]|nr:tRNA 2-selenouridine(34) synthase MnmH [Gammaproteobacteria bacterium]
MSQQQLEALLAQGTPFIDVRAPAEYATGAVPGAINLPLLDDGERHQVGITYKQDGASAAVARGEKLVSGAVKRARIESWRSAVSAHRNPWLYCWRGGMRSQIAQRWLADEGCEVPRIAGGFKALRRCCLTVLERAAGEKDWMVLAGRTGSGKTVVIGEQPDSIDLEGLANHRGSAFGAQLCAQPPQVSFENSLAVAFMQLPGERVLLEDESRSIGRLALPALWHQRMQLAPLVLLERPIVERVGNIRREYVEEPLAAGTPSADLHDRYGAALDRIRKRLGGARHREVAASLAVGFETGEHERWIEQLLIWYYDPMYDYQLDQKQQRVIARGGIDEVREFLRDRVLPPRRL